MIRLRKRVQVSRSPADCYRYMQDLRSSEQWNPLVRDTRKRSLGAINRDSQFEMGYRLAGRYQVLRYRITDRVPSRSLTFWGVGDRCQTREKISFTPVDNSQFTEISYSLELETGGLPKSLQAIAKVWLSYLGRRGMANLGRALEPSRFKKTTFWRRLRYRTLLPAACDFSRRGYRSMPDHGLSDFIDDQIIVITGATSGLGLAAAKELSRLGAILILVGRDSKRLAESQRAVRAFSGCGVDALHTVEADLAELETVRSAARRIRRLTPEIHGLINNAGAMFGERDLTSEGNERTLAVNLLAPYLLTEKLLPALEQGHGRVINVASGGLYLQALHLQDMEFENEQFDGAKAYARAKRALVSQTEHWAEQYPRICFHSMHPGWADTPGVERALPAFYRRVGRWFRTPHQGADTMVWLASTPLAAQKSGYFWFDRRPSPTEVLPGTGVTVEQRKQLARWLAARCRPGHGGPVQF